jgi:hypothetical protein
MVKLVLSVLLLFGVAGSPVIASAQNKPNTTLPPSAQCHDAAPMPADGQKFAPHNYLVPNASTLAGFRASWIMMYTLRALTLVGEKQGHRSYRKNAELKPPFFQSQPEDRPTLLLEHPVSCTLITACITACLVNLPTPL